LSYKIKQQKISKPKKNDLKGKEINFEDFRYEFWNESWQSKQDPFIVWGQITSVIKGILIYKKIILKGLSIVIAILDFIFLNKNT